MLRPCQAGRRDGARVAVRAPAVPAVASAVKAGTRTQVLQSAAGGHSRSAQAGGPSQAQAADTAGPVAAGFAAEAANGRAASANVSNTASQRRDMPEPIHPLSITTKRASCHSPVRPPPAARRG
jgi:hypothetical protein